MSSVIALSGDCPSVIHPFQIVADKTRQRQEIAGPSLCSTTKQEGEIIEREREGGRERERERGVPTLELGSSSALRLDTGSDHDSMLPALGLKYQGHTCCTTTIDHRYRYRHQARFSHNQDCHSSRSCTASSTSVLSVWIMSVLLSLFSALH